MAIITILSASANAIIAGFLYQESITDCSEFSYGEMFKQAGLAFLGGLIVGGLSILATFLVFALALTALECMLCMMICGVLGILTDSISDTFFSDNEIVNQILKYVSQGLYGAGLTFGLAGIAGGGITYGGADDAAGYSPKGTGETVDDLPSGWTKTSNNGFIHIRDEYGVIRIRIDPPTAQTPFDHIHFYDELRNPLDINGNIVPKNSPSAHIPINPEGI